MLMPMPMSEAPPLPALLQERSQLIAQLYQTADDDVAGRGEIVARLREVDARIRAARQGAPPEE